MTRQLSERSRALKSRLSPGGAAPAPGGREAEAAIRPLDEQKAIEVGANFIGEAIVFGVAGLLLVVDSMRSHRAEMARRRLIQDKFEQLFEDVQVLTGRLHELEQSS